LAGANVGGGVKSGDSAGMSDNGGAVTIGVGVGASQLPTEHANASFGLVQPAACTSEHAGAAGGCSAGRCTRYMVLVMAIKYIDFASEVCAMARRKRL
jgi:hypothetical protein